MEVALVVQEALQQVYAPKSLGGGVVGKHEGSRKDTAGKVTEFPAVSIFRG
jgi:hypothetical protein